MYFKLLFHRPLALILFFCLNLTQMAFATLPDLGTPDLASYDTQTEKKLGEAFSTVLHNQYPLLDDPESLSILRHIGVTLSQQVSPPRTFTFYLIQSPEINAFAGPNGIIGINTGLILKANTEDELAAVMAHEMAHVTQQHLARNLNQQPQIALTSFASLLAAILIGTQDPSAGFAAYLGSTGLNLQQQLKNSRLHEKEADNIGMHYLSRAGYDPHAMANFFAKLSQEAQFNQSAPPEILLTHPVTQNRLAEAENRASQLPAHPEHKSLDFEILKIRLHTLTRTTPPVSTAELSPSAQCYLKNVQWHITNDLKRTHPDLNCLKKSIKDNPQHLYLRLLYAQILTQLEHLQLAQKQYALLYNLYPHNSALIHLYSQFLAETHAPNKAIHILKSALSDSSSDNPYLLYQTLSQLYAMQNQMGYADYYQAKAYQTIGDHKRYQYLLRQAQKKMPPEDTKLKLEIQREINTIKETHNASRE